MLAFLATPIGRGVAGFLGVCILLAAMYTTFKLWLHNHDASVRSGYVLLSEKTAAEAEVNDMKKQIAIASKTLEEVRKRQLADDLVIQAKDAKNEKDIADYEQKLKDAKDEAGKPVDNRCIATDNDARFLSNH